MRRLGRVVATAIIAAVSVLTVQTSPARAASPIPAGYEVTSRTELAAGVEYLALRRERPPLVVHVARIAPDAPVSLRAVLSNEHISGDGPRLERTSSMCARVRCLVALNGDFAAVGLDQPIGGLVTNGTMVRSPSTTHHQLSLTEAGALITGSFAWSGTLVATDLKAPLTLQGVNVAPVPDGVVLYTPAFGATTETTGPETSIVVRTVEPAGPLRLGQTSLVELVALREGAANLVIPADGGLLTGHGAGAGELTRLWGRIQAGDAGARALLRLETADDIVESLGGSPILMRDGKRWFADVDDNFTRGRHPRTLVGWNGAGETLLVTVDGRQPGKSVGMTLAEATDLLLSLGATEGMNLDGGGSTTFVANGEVANQPSDVAVRRRGTETIRHMAGRGDTVVGHVERPVASAIAVVPQDTVAAPPIDPLAVPSLGLPQALALPISASTDPGSVPDGTLPALVSEEGNQLADRIRVTGVAANTAALAALAGVALRRRRRVRIPAAGPRRPPRSDWSALAS